MAERVWVEVVYAEPDRVLRRSLEVPAGTTVETAVALSGLGSALPGLELAAMPVGRFGRPVERAAVVEEGDRLELLRPLLMDPKQARRLRDRARRDAG